MKPVDVQPSLLDIRVDDLPLVEQWLQADHVRTYWGDPAANLRQLRATPGPGHRRAIIAVGGRKVGLVLWQHPTREELDQAGLTDIPTSAIDIDLLVGERDAVGRGIGSAALRLLAETVLADPAVPFVMGCARCDNLVSQRAFARAGFRKDREFDDAPCGRHVLMLRHRHGARGDSQ